MIPGATGHGTGVLESSSWQNADVLVLDVSCVDRKRIEYELIEGESDVTTALAMVVDKPSSFELIRKLIPPPREDVAVVEDA